MNFEKLVTADKLSKIRNYDQFFELSQSVANVEPKELFELLLRAATQNDNNGASAIASMLLIEIEPKCPCSCAEVLLKLAESKWDLSDKFVPFYMVTQFGKWNLLCEIEKQLESSSLNAEGKVILEGVRYWARMPASSLSSDLTYFEWQEVIESKNA